MFKDKKRFDEVNDKVAFYPEWSYFAKLQPDLSGALFVIAGVEKLF